ncbi:MAG: hypothetical protein BMS9Abin05_0261 [Rhodothermia bacterium]|nr:MAG: hypothetical protein BMS9Abin05_0261 [Rhodothermia bacterium]
MSPVLLIDAIPDSIEIIILTIIWLAAGIAGGFFLYRVRHKKELGLFEARETALGNREKEFARIRAAMKAQKRTDNSDTLEATITLLREELEQKSLEISITKEEHDLDLRILQDEIESLKRGPGEAAGFVYEIEDVEFSTESFSEASSETISEEMDASENVAPDAPDNESDDSPITPASSESEKGESKAPGSEPSEKAEPEREPYEKAEPAREPSEKVESVTDWATNIISYIFGEISSTIGTSEVESAAKGPTPPEAEPSSDQKHGERQIETGDITIPEFPQFKSLTDLFPLLNLDEGDSETLDPDESSSETKAVGLQILLGLTDGEFRDLRELGLASYESIAQLSSSDISSLSEKFEIPASRIEQIWISGAQLRLYEGS